jgi:predicted nucleic acid-binding protein
VKRVFVDTSGFFALIVAKDENHSSAHDLFKLAEHEAWGLVTTNAVIFETHALLLHCARPGRETALEFLDAVQADT